MEERGSAVVCAPKHTVTGFCANFGRPLLLWHKAKAKKADAVETADFSPFVWYPYLGGGDVVVTSRASNLRPAIFPPILPLKFKMAPPGQGYLIALARARPGSTTGRVPIDGLK